MASKRAVIIDDDHLVRELIKQVLQDLGYETITYETAEEFIGDQGVHNCSSDEPCYDALFTDFCMPGMDGVELIKRLRDKNCQIPKVAVISGSLYEEDRKMLSPLNCQVFGKPFNPDEIAAWLTS